ncbi:SMI1/KNR4 family protein [Pseudomonas sp. PDM28]|uniref:SMI1/KNR4 family protein n=1 Tax=Pseudomonas sp. PDM28 TaxID=2854770 RepID=UPI001C480C62|nr:SMI1/KNR4 family protein [Pseudomonas sp. PDM28]MBV7555190.1 SMI1/KNR4 family protein [Pseudomonas sp. PDM28]
MSLVDTYLAGLRLVLPAENLDQLKLAHGASATDLQQLTEQYPLCPASLLQLLSQIDGTHFRDYHDGTVMVLMLGSDVFEYPYYLRSVRQILEGAHAHTRSIAQIYESYLDQEPDLIDPLIDSTLPMNKRLCFSHCMNNGGTSRLYIDFNPAPGGTVGQVMRFLHDPDSYKVIAQSFDYYLQQLIDDHYSFIYGDE